MELTGIDTKVTRGHGAVEELLARLRQRMAERLIPDGHREGRILDIGCGSFPLFLSQTRFRERHGLDRVSEQKRHEWARKGLCITNQDLELDHRLPYNDRYFTTVSMLAVFEHIQPGPLVELLHEVLRVLEPGGIFVMTTPASWAGGVLKVMARLQLVSSEEIEEHKHTYSHGEIRELLQQAGFARDRIRLGYFEAFMNNWGAATR